MRQVGVERVGTGARDGTGVDVAQELRQCPLGVAARAADGPGDPDPPAGVVRPA
jgi:hypothetical protein